MIFPFLKLLRPHQWLKNLMLLFPPFLGGALVDLSVLKTAPVSLLAFCFASSSTYIINDIVDAPNDAQHPQKKLRPIASGTVSSTVGAAIAVLLFLLAFVLSWQVSGVFCGIVGVYMVLSLAYTFRLKQVAVVDLFCIAVFFLLRLEAGGQAFDVKISEWLFLSVFLLALFLSTGKRLCERDNLGLVAVDHRKSLHDYPDGLLDGIMYMTGAAVLVTYTLYIISKHGMVYTVPLCCFGLVRYMYRVKKGQGGDPTYALLQDPVLFVVGGLWVVLTAVSIY